ncbi:hypothetical protein HKCCSP123_07805 [Rhodobacterales bacterium HKCCSP123]|nr:hypothetical protein [Rhodobacterales bacterium HKCCSP123]
MNPSKVSLRSFRNRMGDGAVLFIRPREVQYHSGTKWAVAKTRSKRLDAAMPRVFMNILLRILKSREPFVIPRHYFRDIEPITGTPRYEKVADFIASGGPVEETLWFRQLVADLESNGIARHKKILMRNRAEISGFLETYAAPLVESLKSEGFSTDKGDYEASAIIDADGRLVKASSGNHRFAIAHVLDLPVFPLRVAAVHEDWYREEVASRGDNWLELQAALERVEDRHR